MRLLLPVVVLAVLGGATGVAGSQRPETQWLLMVHLDSRGGLGQAAEAYVAQFKGLAGPEVSVALQVIGQVEAKGTSAVSRRVYGGAGRGERGLAPRQLAALDRGQALLVEFLNLYGPRYPARHQALIVLGHGRSLTGLPEVVAGGLGGREVAEALRAATALPKPLSIVALDTCYGASVEAIYELRNLTHYLTAAPTLMCSPGLQWGQLGSLLRSEARGAPAAVVQAVVGSGNRRGTGVTGPLGLVAVEVGQVDQLVVALRGFVETLREHLDANAGALTLVRSRCLSYGAQDELCDLGQLAEGLARQALTPTVRERAAMVAHRTRELVFAEWWQGAAAQDYRLSGVGIYFPATLEQMPGNYQASYGFAGETGWSDFLTAYWGRIRQTLGVMAE